MNINSSMKHQNVSALENRTDQMILDLVNMTIVMQIIVLIEDHPIIETFVDGVVEVEIMIITTDRILVVVMKETFVTVAILVDKILVGEDEEGTVMIDKIQEVVEKITFVTVVISADQTPEAEVTSPRDRVTVIDIVESLKGTTTKINGNSMMTMMGTGSDLLGVHIIMMRE